MTFAEKPRGASLRSRLTLLVAGSILPLAAVAAITTYILSKAYDETASARLLQLSRSVLSNIEGQLEAVTTAEEVLAVSDALQSDDFDRFRQDAQAFLRTFMPSANLVLSDQTGRQIVNTSAAEPMATRQNLSEAVIESHRHIFATGKPQLTQLFKGQVIGQFAVSIEVPVLRDGKVVYILGMPITSRTLSGMLADQKFDPRWTVALWDRGGKVVARFPDWERYVGREAAPSILPAIRTASDEVITTTTFSGDEVLTAMSHSPQTGLTLALGVPRGLIVAPRRQALLLIALFSLLCFLLSAFAATRQARSLLAAEHTRDLLIEELNHRVGNLLSTVQGIAQETVRLAKSKEEAGVSIQGRIMALAGAHRLLTEENWKAATLRSVLEAALDPFVQATGRITLSGSDVMRVTPKAALAITLAMNELATNAVKYGALSAAGGHVKVDWGMESERHINITWEESGGPPVTPPTRHGFGSVLLSRGLAGELGSKVTLEYRREGVLCVLRCAVDKSA